MGMYTALSLGVEFEKDTSYQIIRTIRRMLGHDIPFEAWPEEKLFEHMRAEWMLRCGSYYFSWQTHWDFRKDDVTKTWFLSGVCNLKNYGQEIELFLNWIMPHLNTRGYIGWMMYEDDDDPTLLYRTNGKLISVKLGDSAAQYHAGHLAGEKHIIDKLKDIV